MEKLGGLQLLFNKDTPPLRNILMKHPKTSNQVDFLPPRQILEHLRTVKLWVLSNAFSCILKTVVNPSQRSPEDLHLALSPGCLPSYSLGEGCSHVAALCSLRLTAKISSLYEQKFHHCMIKNLHKCPTTS